LLKFEKLKVGKMRGGVVRPVVSPKAGGQTCSKRQGRAIPRAVVWLNVGKPKFSKTRSWAVGAVGLLKLGTYVNQKLAKEGAGRSWPPFR